MSTIPFAPIGYGDILLVRPEEYIVGYHYIVPVCCEEYIFDIPFSASPSTLLVRYEEFIVSAFLRRLHSRSTLSASSSPPSLHICAAGIYWSTVYNQFSLALPVTNPYLVRDFAH